MTSSLILVVGMHRSGTSAVAGALNICGVHLGGPLVPANGANPAGYWEHAGVVAAHDEALGHAGHSWDDPVDLHLARWVPDVVDTLVTRLRPQVFGLVDGQPAAIKDPRLSRLLPLWFDRVLPGLDVEPRVLVVHRPVADVIRSLQRRDGFSAEKSVVLWADHLIRAMIDSRGYPRALLSYPDLMGDPVGAVRSALEGLQVEIAEPVDRHDQALGEFLSPPIASALPEAKVPPELEELVSAVMTALDYPEVADGWADAQRLLDQYRRGFEGVGHEHLSNLIVGVQNSLDGLASLVGERTQWLQAHDEQIRTLERCLEQPGSGLSAPVSDRGNRSTEVAALDDRLAALEGLVGRIDVALTELIVSTDDDRQWADALRQVVDSGERRESEAISAVGDLAAQIGPLVNELRDARDVLEQEDRKSAVAAADVHLLRHEVEQARGRTEDHHRWLDQVASDIAEHAGHILRFETTLDRSASSALNLARRVKSRAGREISKRRAGPVASVERPPGPLTLPVSDTPRVSIIIPIFNQVDLTLDCLRSIAAHPPSVDFEVLVVDDCSTDPGVQRLRQVPGLRTLTTAENGGFVRSCNHGAANAEGSLLYFLNNDTILEPEAVDHLVHALDAHPRAQVAGSKLLNGDGTVQEAGGIMWRDGSAWNYGRGLPRDTPKLNYTRSVDYVSGASLMVPKSVFDELGGFDEAYVPAYYEDGDFCTRVRSLGHHVLYVPHSEVFHLEGQSYGTDTKRSGKKHMVTNHATFAARWSTFLEDHRPNAVEPDLEKDRGVIHRTLVIDARMLKPDHDAGALRMFHILRLLRQAGHQVTFLPQNLLREEPYGRSLEREGIQVVTSPHIGSVSEFLAAHAGDYDTILMSRLEVVERCLVDARAANPDARLVFDTVDLHFLREERELEIRGVNTLDRSPTTTRQQELLAVRSVDCTIVCSSAEKELLAELAPRASVAVVPTVTDEPRTPGGPNGRRDLLFVGSFQHPPNADGITWFATEVLPLVHKDLPDTVLHIVGSNPSNAVLDLADPTVRVHGYVPSLDRFYETARVCLAPLRFGAGVKGKISEALARGVPVAATSTAAEGMGLAAGTEVLVGDSPDELAQVVVQLLTDSQMWSRFADAGRVAFDRSFSLESIGPELHAAVGTPDP
ncbi:MAG: glycosyltransferase [Actinomycetia bacterium]|nr:glycosyltransferase [Actinomycetes bacterium]